MRHITGVRRGSDQHPAGSPLAQRSKQPLADYVTTDLGQPVPLDMESLRHLKPTEMSVPGFYRAGAASIHDDLLPRVG